MMHELPQNAPSIAREAKGLTQGLKESLKKHEPWDREIEFQRANLRRQYLQLIFVHPYAKESKDADHSLWMTTSYFNITAYKQRIAAADAVTHQSGSESHGHGRGHHNHGKPSGVVEHRKLVHRFRQFLAEEEKFWTSLIVRAVRVFGLDDARPTLAALGIPMPDPEPLDASPSRSDRRNVFPSEEATETPSHAQKEQKLVMLSKALVCLGDIARYREHYNEAGGRPRAGKDFHEDSKSAGRGRGGRRGAIEQPPRPRNYSKAQECYERARVLVPDVGNASHQLAILANYQQDPFASVLQYYRAICVKYPYDTAASNLDSTLSRNLEGYRVTLAKLEGGANEAPQPPKLRVERFKKSLVALHGLWKVDPAEADTLLLGHDASVLSTFSSLVSERVLPTDIIWKTLVLALGALWRFRIIRDPNAKRDTKRAHGSIEVRILAHVLGILRTLLQIGSVQLTDASTSPEPAINGAAAGSGEAQADLAQNITAVFRRTLPALRIGSKWLSVHFGYLGDVSSRLGVSELDTDVSISVVMSEFWASYTTFASLLGNIFPVERLPKMTVPLEEDVDVSGFAPLKRAMFDPSMSSASGLEPGQSQVHPNEEQLMRIADLLRDAEAISKFADSPVDFKDNKFVQPMGGAETDAIVAQSRSMLPSPEAIPTNIPSGPQNSAEGSGAMVREEAIEMEVQSDADDDNATVSTRTEDDPVNLAMTAQLESDDDEMDEQVLYPKQTIVPPAASISNANSFSTPSMRTKPLSPPRALTAEDLVNDMMRPRGTAVVDPPVSRTTGTQLPAPSLLFGSGSPSAPTSIWSTTTHDSAALSANNLRITGYPGAQSRVSPPALQAYGSGGLGPVPPLTPPRGGYGHQRQLSQPLPHSSVSPTHHGSWVSQDSSQLGLTQSQSQSQPMYGISPPSASFAPQQPMVASRNFQQQVPSPPYWEQQQQRSSSTGFSNSLNNQAFARRGPAQQLSPLSVPSGLPSQNAWSYSGTGSLHGIGAPLGPFAAEMPYAQPRLQQQAQMQRPGAWAPS